MLFVASIFCSYVLMAASGNKHRVLLTGSDEIMCASLSNPEVECVDSFQSISESSSQHDVKLCLQNTAGKKKDS